MTETLNIHEVAYHRNGVSGNGFYVVSFFDPEEQREMVGVLFPAFNPNTDEWDFQTEINTAVFDRDLLGKGTIAFTVNSWRGDRYHDRLVAAIKDDTADEADLTLTVLKSQAATTLRGQEIQGEVRKQNGLAQDYRDATDVGEDWQWDELRARRQADDPS